MIFGILLVGIVMISTALKGTEKELAQQLQHDLLGQDGFLLWGGSFVAIGAIGYIPGLERTSRYLLALVIVVIVVRNGGLFQQAEQALQLASTAGPAPSVTVPADTSSSGTSSTGSTSGASGVNTAANVGSTIAKLAPLALAFL